MRRVVALALALAAAAGVLASSAAAATAPKLSETGTRFPDRVYVLNLPKRERLTSSSVVVTENGQPVDNLTVTSPGTQTATMLLIDASLTMRGKPIADAMRAARAFAAQRNPSQRLAIATFNSQVSLLLPFTSNTAEINDALARTPDTAYGTVVYDAVDYAIQQIRESGSRVGTIVLLADGQNVGSKTTLTDAVRRLKDEGVRLFSVGLRSPAYYGPPLRRLSDRSGGSYVEASSSEGLARIYNALGYRLANEYLLLYRSLEGPEKPVTVAVRVAGYPVVKTSYTTPALGLATGPVEKSLLDRIVQSWVFLLFIVVVFMGLLVYGVATIADLRRRSLRSRLARFVDMEDAHAMHVLSREELTARLERVGEALERRGWVERFAERCDVAGIQTPAGTLMLTSIGAGLVVGVALAALSSALWLLLVPLAPLAMSWFVGFRARRAQKAFGEQLPDNLEVLAAALRVGHSLVGGLSHMADDAAEPSRREFRRVIADEQFGIPLEDALRKVATRMDNRDMEQLALVAMLQRETGGASADVIDQVTFNIRGRMDVRRLVRSLTAQGRLARWIVSIMPLVLVAMILVIFPEYLDPLFQRTIGIVALVIAGFMVVCGSLVIKRIVEIKV